MLVSANFTDVSPKVTDVKFIGNVQGRDDYNECIARWKDEGGYVPSVSQTEEKRHSKPGYQEPRKQPER